MSVAADLVSTLDAAGLGVPVSPPGASVGSLPRIQVVPSDDEIGGNGAFIVHAYDVTVIVPRDSTVTQLDRLEQLTTDTLRALTAAGYQVGARLRYTAGDAENVHYLSRIIPVYCSGPVFC